MARFNVRCLPYFGHFGSSNTKTGLELEPKVTNMTKFESKTKVFLLPRIGNIFDLLFNFTSFPFINGLVWIIGVI